MMIIKNVNIVNQDQTIFGYVEFDSETGLITKVQKGKTKAAGIDAQSQFLLPGFIDTHTHGGYGFNFMDFEYKNYDNNLNKYLTNIYAEGVTTVMATSVSCREKALLNIAKNLSSYVRMFPNSVILGWHIEGPFISKIKKGAHDQTKIISLNLDLLDRIANDTKDVIKILVVAPETLSSLLLIKKCCENFCVAIGHSDASAPQTFEAIKNGAGRITHLYNHTSQFTHRDPGIVNAAFLSPKLHCELICDGYHVDPLVIANTYAIVGAKRLIMVSDSLSCKGLKDGIYKIGSLDIDKKGPICFLKNTNTIAGSAMTFNEQIKVFLKATNCSFEDIVKITSFNAAQSLDVRDKLGFIAPKYTANLVLVDKSFDVKLTIKNGTIVYKQGD